MRGTLFPEGRGPLRKAICREEGRGRKGDACDDGHDKGASRRQCLRYEGLVKWVRADSAAKTAKNRKWGQQSWRPPVLPSSRHHAPAPSSPSRRQGIGNPGLFSRRMGKPESPSLLRLETADACLYPPTRPRFVRPRTRRHRGSTHRTPARWKSSARTRGKSRPLSHIIPVSTITLAAGGWLLINCRIYPTERLIMKSSSTSLTQSCSENAIVVATGGTAVHVNDPTMNLTSIR